MVILFLLVIGLISIFLIFTKYKKNEPFHPPPGPKGYPIIGNLYQYDFLAPHVYLAKLAKTYGPIVLLRLGFAPVVVVQSAKLAREVLKTQDLNFCSRPSTVGIRKLSYNGLDIAFSPYNEYFREVKKISIVHLLSSIRVKSFAPILHEEISRLMNKISTNSSASVDLSDLLTSFACTNICKIAFGRSYEDDEGTRSKFRSLQHGAEEAFIDLNFSDYSPYLGWIDKLTGKSAKLEKIFQGLDTFYEKIISDHLHSNIIHNKNRQEQDEDLVDVLLQLKNEPSSLGFDFTLNHVKAILMDIFMAGTDTNSAMIIWAMTELIKNPIPMKKVQQELRNVPTKTGYIVEEDLQNMEYFKAVIKETFRLHPAAPLLVAHETIRKSKLQGYDILPKTVVFVNVWAIGRDPESWTAPDKFMPERFLGSSIDFKGQDFELLPFGAGRRMCPGMHLGTLSVELTLANLLYKFEWELPAGVCEDDIDTITLPGVTSHKKTPLCLVAKKFI